MAWTAVGAKTHETKNRRPAQAPHRRPSIPQVRARSAAQLIRAGRLGATGLPVCLGSGGRGTIL